MANSEVPKEPMTWMLVEDDGAIRDVIEMMCELWGFKVLSFRDGFQAVDYLKNEALAAPLPEVALLDIRMPGPWGHEISARIRQHPQLKHIGIILMTAYELPGQDEEKYLESSGADKLLFKPLPPMDELLIQVQEAIKARKDKSGA